MTTVTVYVMAWQRPAQLLRERNNFVKNKVKMTWGCGLGKDDLGKAFDC